MKKKLFKKEQPWTEWIKDPHENHQLGSKYICKNPLNTDVIKPFQQEIKHKKCYIGAWWICIAWQPLRNGSIFGSDSALGKGTSEMEKILFVQIMCAKPK